MLTKVLEMKVSKIKGLEKFGGYIVYSNGDVYSEKTNKMLKKLKTKKGYYEVELSNKPYKKRIKIHRLVGLAFIPNYESKPQINHKNGIKTDNRVQNLEWCTNQENHIHKCKNGLNIVPENAGRAKRPVLKLNPINYQVIDCYSSIADAARENNNLNHSNLKAVCDKKRNLCGGFKWCYKSEVMPNE